MKQEIRTKSCEHKHIDILNERISANTCFISAYLQGKVVRNKFPSVDCQIIVSATVFFTYWFVLNFSKLPNGEVPGP